MRRVSPLLLVLVAATLVGVALVWPVWAAPGSLAPGTRFTDGHLIGVALWGEALARGELPALTTPLVGWPGGAALRPLLWPSALLGALTGPALAVNLTFALVPAFNVLAGALLGRALGRSAAGSALLGGLLAAHPWVVETLTNGQVEQAVLGGAAMQLAAGLWAARGPAVRIVVPMAVTALVGWAAPHVALAGAVLTGLFGTFELVDALRRRDRTGARWLAVLMAVALGALAVQAYHGPSFAPGVHVFSPKGSDGRPTSLADLPEVATLRGLLMPPAARPTVPVFHPTWLGACALVGAAWALGAALWRGRAAGLDALAEARAGARPRAPGPGRFVAIAALFALLALGPSTQVGATTLPLPWAALGVVAPTVLKSMSAYRMVAGAVIALAAAASAAPRAAGSALLLAGLALLEGPLAATRPMPIAAQVAHVDGGRSARAAGEGPVLDLPLAGAECPNGAGHYLLEAAVTGRPVPLLLKNPREGYAAVPELAGGLARTWSRADCATALPSFLARLPFPTVVLHRHDRHCPAPKRMVDCLEAALGPGTTEGGVTWWDVESAGESWRPVQAPRPSGGRRGGPDQPPPVSGSP
jgi:hypothetical protein